MGFEKIMKKICVFCGSSKGSNNDYLIQTDLLGKEMARRGMELVYGGGSVGLMGQLSKSIMENSGRVTGIITEKLVGMEVANSNLTELKIVKTMHERKSLMNEMSDAFITLPGGIGTIEETFEMFTWMQLDIHHKPMGILNTAGFYDKLLEFLVHVVDEEFLRKEHLDRLIVETDPEKLLDEMEKYEHEPSGKWFDIEKNSVR